MTLC